MGAAAVSAAEAVSYVGAGTVEFLLDAAGSFYFLEMNTRLQVEHPVTEMVTGLDLVRLQLLVAAGEPLPPEAHGVEPDGHAIEVRLYAEDPAADFLPQTGTLAGFGFLGLDGDPAPTFAAPDRATPSAGVRVDSGFEAGDVVSPHYDPMLAKVIAWAPSRAEAAAALARSLRAGRADGLVNNRDFLVRVLAHPAFSVGRDRHRVPRASRGTRRAADRRRGTAHRRRRGRPGGTADAERPGPLGFAPRGWRNNPSVGINRAFEGADGAIEVTYRLDRNGALAELLVEGEPLAGAALAAPPLPAPPEGRGTVELVVDGVRRTLHRPPHRRRRLRQRAGRHGCAARAAALSERRGRRRRGRARRADARQGDPPGAQLRRRGRAREVIAVLEAMKMEHELTAPAEGTITELRVAEGEQVDSGAIIGVIEPRD